MEMEEILGIVGLVVNAAVLVAKIAAAVGEALDGI